MEGVESGGLSPPQRSGEGSAKKKPRTGGEGEPSAVRTCSWENVKEPCAHWTWSSGGGCVSEIVFCKSYHS